MQEEDEVDAFITLTIIPDKAESDPSSSEDVIPTSKDVTSKTIFSADESTPMETSPTSTSVVDRSNETSTVVLTEGTQSDSYNSRDPSSADISFVNAPEMSSRHEGTPISTDVGSSVSEVAEEYTDTEKTATSEMMLSENDHSQLPNPIIVLQNAVQHRRQIEATKKLRKRHFLYLTDTGGQPEFRELLPLFLPGPTTTFIVFDLRYEFHSIKEVEFLQSDLVPVKYGKTFTVKEVINDILQNIYCSKSQSTVVFIGTHKDLLPASELQSIMETKNQDLRKLLQDCPYYQEDMLIQSDEKNIIFCVDNASVNKSHSFVRSAVVGLCNDIRFSVKVKPRWLLFAITLKGAQTVCMSYEDSISLKLKSLLALVC